MINDYCQNCVRARDRKLNTIWYTVKNNEWHFTGPRFKTTIIRTVCRHRNLYFFIFSSTGTDRNFVMPAACLQKLIIIKFQTLKVYILPIFPCIANYPTIHAGIAVVRYTRDIGPKCTEGIIISNSKQPNRFLHVLSAPELSAFTVPFSRFPLKQPIARK